MMIVVVPLWPPPGWSPAFDAVRLGETVAAGFDARQWASVRGLTILSVDVALHPLLTLATPPALVDGVCRFDLVVPTTLGPGAAVPGGIAELPIEFTVRVADDLWQAMIFLARLPVLPPVPGGLVDAGTAVRTGAIADDIGFLTDANGVVIFE